MIFSEKWGKDVEEATELALKDLKLSKEEVTVTIVEEPSKGFLGLGSKLAKVRVEKKEEESADKIEKEPTVEEDKLQNVESVKKAVKQTKKEEELSPQIGETDTVLSSLLNKPDDLEPVEEHVGLDFLKSTAEKMGLELAFQAQGNQDSLYIDIEGKDAGTIIGKRGQTLDAVQYLTSLVVNKENKDYVRVVLDAENYREKREKTLKNLAMKLAGKVVKTRKYVKLEPMNPYERMVIHATLQNNPRVETCSDGEEPYRRVIIKLK